MVNRQFKQHEEMTRGGEMTLGTRVQVWMFPGRAWNKEDAGSVWTWLMGMGWVVLGVVKTCSDGALDVRI